MFLAACGSGPDNPEATSTSKDTTTAPAVDSAASATADNTLTDQEKNDGWKLLFDGKSTSGWHPYNHKGDLSEWKVADGILYLDTPAAGGTKGVDPVTDDEFENFHLKVDWKISKTGNSGIIFSVKEDKKYGSDYFTGPEMQVLDNKDADDAKNPKHHAGDLYDLIAASPEVAKPAGEWNSAEVYKNKDSLVLTLNGTDVVKTKLWDANWKKLVAGSKFKQWPDFGTFKKGHIALQDHGHTVWYKNIKIKTL